MQLCPIAVIVITFNEEVNLPNALNSVSQWAEQVFVVDSYSTDNTTKVAETYGAKTYQNTFKSVGAQRNWALNNLPIKGDWVLFIDGDEYLSEEIKQEISTKLGTIHEDVHGFYTQIKYKHFGRWLRHGDLYQNLIRMIRKDKGTYIDTEGWHEKMNVTGKVSRLNSYIIHDDQKDLSEWISKQNIRISNDARERIENDLKAKSLPLQNSNNGSTIEGGGSRWLRNMVLLKLPSQIRPFTQFLYRYILRLGFLDGWPGFIYHFQYQFWYPLMVEVLYYQLKKKKLIEESK